jgi:hypothetical protein
MLRIDELGLFDWPKEFDGTQATELIGDWWATQIKVPGWHGQCPLSG